MAARTGENTKEERRSLDTRRLRMETMWIEQDIIHSFITRQPVVDIREHLAEALLHNHLVPASWAEELAKRSIDSLPDSRIGLIHGVVDINVTPPLWCSGVGEEEGEEDDNGRDEETSVKSSGGDVVVLESMSTWSEIGSKGRLTWRHHPLKRLLM